MTLKRVNLLADFTFHAPGDCERTFTAGVRSLPAAAAAAAQAKGLLGKLPSAPKAPAKPKAAPKKTTKAKA